MKRRHPKARASSSQSPTAAPANKFDSAPRLVQIEKPVYGGAFLARVEGKAVFVPLSLPGEQVRARIIEDKRSYATAEAEEIVSAAAERTKAPCPYFGPCGGCQYQHAEYAAQLRFKQAILRETLERAGIAVPDEIEVLSGEPWAYRNRIRLAFDAHGNLGYRSRRSHQVIPIAECPISAPILVKAALEFARLNRSTAPGMRAKEIALFCDRDETALLVSVILDRPVPVRLDEIAAALKDRIPALAGMEVVTESRAEQLPHLIARWGQNSLVYTAAGFDYRVEHGAFFQVNRWILDSFVERVTAGQRGSLAWDLFAGVGLFSRKLAGTFNRVVAVESATVSTQALSHNLARSSAEVVPSPTLEFLRRNRNAERPDLIVVDPPRTGLGAETSSVLAEICAPAIIYVSCDPATLARDLRALLTAGYVMEDVILADLFPQTFHLESVVRLHLG
jgi:23S rRNA (uracil1939-C5)-methyltransferase